MKQAARVPLQPETYAFPLSRVEMELQFSIEAGGWQPSQHVEYHGWDNPVLQRRDRVYSLAELHAYCSDFYRCSWTFADGVLKVDARPRYYVVCGVPHCGNRYTRDLLWQAAASATVLHPEPCGTLSAAGDALKVVALRDPAKAFLSWWKHGELQDHSGAVLLESKLQRFVECWQNLPADAYLHFVDRDPAEQLWEHFGLAPVSDKPAPKHQFRPLEGFVSVNRAKLPAAVRKLAKKWGYT